VKYLVYCISVACFLPVAKAGQINISPTIELGVHDGRVNSTSPFLNRDGLVKSSVASIDLGYESKKVTSSLDYKWTRYSYNESSSEDTNYQDYTRENSINLWREDLSIKTSFTRNHELLDVIQGNFSDEIYDEETQVVKTIRVYTANYVLPEMHSFNLEVELEHESNSAKSKESSVSVDFSDGYATDRALVSFGRYDSPRSFYWKVIAEKENKERRSLSNTSEIDSNAVVRVPVSKNLRIVANANHSDFKSSSSQVDVSDGNTNSTTVGAGLALFKSKGNSFIQMTVDVDTDSKKKSIGSQVYWSFDENLSVSYSRVSQFFGKKDSGNLTYSGLNNSFSLNYSEGVDYRYSTGLLQENLGFYVCSPDDLGNFIFDESLCKLPVSGDLLLEPGFQLIPNIKNTYPIQVRLTNEKSYGVSWAFQKDGWTHTVNFKKASQSDVQADYQEDTFLAGFHTEKRLNEKSLVSFDWKLRDVKVNKSRARSTENLYSASYTYELNTRAEWSAKVQFIDKTTPNAEFDYQESRVSLSYKHHFGDQHKERRGF